MVRVKVRLGDKGVDSSTVCSTSSHRLLMRLPISPRISTRTPWGYNQDGGMVSVGVQNCECAGSGGRVVRVVVLRAAVSTTGFLSSLWDLSWLVFG